MSALSIPVLCVLLAFAMALVLVGGFALGVLKILKGDPAHRNKQHAADDTRMIQAIYHQLSKMEDRIEALETILVDRERKEGEK